MNLQLALPPAPSPSIPSLSYENNEASFAEFHALQHALTGHLAAHPRLLRLWLEEASKRAGAGESDTGEPVASVRRWRTARLSAARRRELGELMARAEISPEETSAVAAWLLAAVPVGTYLEIVEAARPEGPVLEAEARECCRRLVEMRDRLFTANYGLAKVAAQRRDRTDYADALSATSRGLLDAVDRYVPGPKAARFGYYARYWIRYHLGRHDQKHRAIVALPINQHRIMARINRYRTRCLAAGQSEPSVAELCAGAGILPEDYYRYRCQPKVCSLHSQSRPGDESSVLENTLHDPAPIPTEVLEEREMAHHLRQLFERHLEPVERLVLAYARSIGVLADAAEDYLADLKAMILENLQRRSAASLDDLPWRLETEAPSDETA